MPPVHPANAIGLPTAERSTFCSDRETLHDSGQKFYRLAIALFMLNAVSSLLFIGFVNRPVYDEPNNLPDVHRYATEGVSLDTIRHHVNPAGPTSFIWMAEAVRLLKGGELLDGRIGALLSWVLLTAGVFFLAR